MNNPQNGTSSLSESLDIDRGGNPRFFPPSCEPNHAPVQSEKIWVEPSIYGGGIWNDETHSSRLCLASELAGRE